MKHLTREEQARRLYRRTYYTALFALCLVGNIAVMGVERFVGSLAGQKWAGGSGVAGGFTIVWMVAAAFIAAWRVRRAGLSREARVIEFFHGAGARARHAMQNSAPFEVRSQPSKPKRAAASFFYAIFMGALGWGGWWALHDPRTSLLLQLFMPIGLVFSALMGVAFLYLLAFDPPDFRADSRGLRGCHGLWLRTIRWEQVETMEIIATHNVSGELALLQPQFKDARGKVLLLMNLAPIFGCSPAARDSIVSFLRAACSEHEGGSSTCEVIGAEVGV